MVFPRPIDKSKDNSVRRVVKQGLFHICGMCGTRYGNEAQAEACLKKCIDRYMAQTAVVNKPEKAGTVYRCAYCKRVYDKLILAKECAKTCKNEIQKKIDAEARFKKSQSVEEKLKNLAAFAGGEANLPPPKPKAPPANDAAAAKTLAKKAETKDDDAAAAKAKRAPAPEAPPPMEKAPAAPKPVHPAEGTKFDREGSAYRCHTCHQKYKKYQEAIACYDLHREQEKAGVQAIKKEGEDKFFRDGAKYVCKKCNAKYFARSEVIDCYDGHKEEDEVWVTGGAKSKKPEKEEVWITGGPGQKKPKPEQTPEAAEAAEAKAQRRATARSDGEKFFRDGAKYVCRICNKKLFTKMEVIQCYDGHAAEEATPETPAAPDSGPILSTKDLDTVAIEKAMQDVKTGPNRDGVDKFFRDGAKYVCKKCNSKYFTRGEVIQCFDKH